LVRAAGRRSRGLQRAGVAVAPFGFRPPHDEFPSIDYSGLKEV
jgi:hypothetical protein